MSQPPEANNPLDPFGFWKSTQSATLDAWSKAMIELVNTDEYAEATGRMMDSYLTVSAPIRKLMEQTMTQVLAQYNLPSRAEVLSLAERFTNIEMRLDDLDARIDSVLRAVEQVSQNASTADAAKTKPARPPAATTTPVTTPMPARRISRANSPATRRAPTTPE